jgi:hypothetical protein
MTGPSEQEEALMEIIWNGRETAKGENIVIFCVSLPEKDAIKGQF